MTEIKKPKQSLKRHLKVYVRYFSRSDFKSVILPEIRLCGKWLRESGFDCGQEVIVQYEENKIVITINSSGKMPLTARRQDAKDRKEYNI